jgi:hypothetical protein
MGVPGVEERPETEVAVLELIDFLVAIGFSQPVRRRVRAAVAKSGLAKTAPIFPNP